MQNNESTTKEIVKILEGKNGRVEMIFFSFIAVFSGVCLMFSGDKNIFSFGLVVVGVPALAYIFYSMKKEKETLSRLLSDTVYAFEDFSKVSQFYQESKNTMCVTERERIDWALEKLKKFKAQHTPAQA